MFLPLRGREYVIILSHMQGQSQDDLAPVWRGLANTTRRRMLDLLADEPIGTGDMATRFPELSRFAVMQHLKVLEEGNLVVRRKDGRRVVNHLNPIPIQQIYHRWVRRFQEPWAEALVGLKTELETEQRTMKSKGAS